MPEENNESDTKPTLPDNSPKDTQHFFPPTTDNLSVGSEPAPPPKKPARQSRWDELFIGMGVLQAVAIALFLALILSAALLQKQGISGLEFLVLIVFVSFGPALAGLSVVNLIGLPVYIWKRKPRGKWLALAIASLLLSALLASYAAYIYYDATVVGKRQREESAQRFEADRQQFAADNDKPEISKDEAITLLKTCKLKGFYYTDQTDKSDPANGGWGELSSTGVVLTKVEGKPHRISIADRLVPELVPIARQAQLTCGGPQFWHDGTYEQYKDGKWYFNDQVVNSAQQGKTQEQAISFMQSCKADYFVGYTDINLVKDANTKSWLNKAEQSATGIEISEGAPMSYVFASKAKTIELQDTARQFRQSCYNQKKLYIAIDNYIEAEYPAGKWTRVSQ